MGLFLPVIAVSFCPILRPLRGAAAARVGMATASDPQQPAPVTRRKCTKGRKQVGGNANLVSKLKSQRLAFHLARIIHDGVDFGR